MYVRGFHKNMKPKDLRTYPTVKAGYAILSYKEGRLGGGLCFGSSKTRKAVHMEMKKQTFGK